MHFLINGPGPLVKKGAPSSMGFSLSEQASDVEKGIKVYGGYISPPESGIEEGPMSQRCSAA